MIELPFPAKILWPNGRGHWAAKNRAFQAHKQWAWAAMKVEWRRGFILRLPLKWSVTFYPKTRHKIDRDNALASLKAYQDGMADALGMNDGNFDTPALHFAEPVKNGRVVIVIGNE